jgi:hypothetical protein
MLKTTTQLVPFGDDSKSQNICGHYLANMGWVDRRIPVKYEYIIGYYEVPSEFNNYKQTEKFLIIPSWDRSKSNFDLLQEIFKKDNLWHLYGTFRDKDKYVCEAMRDRAIKDGLYRSEDAEPNS